jgi:hypothetical protein
VLYTRGIQNPRKDQPMKRVAYVGVDYHVNPVSVAVLIEGVSDFLDCIHIRNEDKMIRKYLKKQYR